MYGVYRYVFGVTHVPRLEDWPVMPVEHVGFNLLVCTYSQLLSATLELSFTSMQKISLVFLQ